MSVKNGVKNGQNDLRFACECVSAKKGGYSEPWASIAKHKLLQDGTKENILNLVALEPKTISQVAGALGLSSASVHMHVRDMLKSELLRSAASREKVHPAERYFEPNFPVINEDEAEELCDLCEEMAAKVAALFKKHQRQLEKAFGKTPLRERGWQFPDVAQCVYASVQRGARELLEKDGTLASSKTHRNGVEWVFWAVKPIKNS